MNQKPSIGRIVHYVAYGTPGGEYKPGVCRSAMITLVHANGSDVGLCVMNPTGLFFNVINPEDQSGKNPGTWHWPERVE